MSCRVNFHVVRRALQYSACRFCNVYVLVIFADHIFIDPTFFDIFVCGPLQSFVVNVCTFLRRFFFSYFREHLYIKIFPVKKNNQYSSLQSKTRSTKIKWEFNRLCFSKVSRKRIKANSLISTAYLTNIHSTQSKCSIHAILTQIIRFWIQPMMLSDGRYTPPGLLWCNFNYVR